MKVYHVYHGTSTINWSRIRDEGLRISDTPELDWWFGPGVYFSIFPPSAYAFALAAVKRKGGEPLVLEATLPDKLIWKVPAHVLRQGDRAEMKAVGFSGCLITSASISIDRGQVVVWDAELLKKLRFRPIPPVWRFSSIRYDHHGAHFVWGTGRITFFLRRFLYRLLGRSGANSGS